MYKLYKICFFFNILCVILRLIRLCYLFQGTDSGLRLVQGRRPTLKKPNHPKQGKKDITILIKDELQANR
jgi:hypothetical protein